MRRKTLLLLTTILAVSIMASNGGAQGVPETRSVNSPGQQGTVKTIFSFKNEIGLTDDQEVKLKALLYDEQSQMGTDSNMLKTLGTQLSQMVQNKQDLQLIKNKLEEIAKVQVGISYRNILYGRNVETILTPDQLAKWRDIQRRYSSQPKT